MNPNTYAYDGDGRRVKKISNNGAETSIFVYNALGQMVAEYNNLPRASESQTSYLTNDTLGTPRVITKADGSVKSRHDYLPFGEELQAGTGGRTTNQGYSQFNGNRKNWAQLERDDETGLDYAQARYYSSAQGRFTSPDEFKGGPDELFVLGSGDGEKQALPYADITSPQSLNKYQYCLNNPLRYVDPDGHQEEPKKKGVVESVIDYLGSMLRPAMKQGGQQEQDAWDNDDNPRGTAPVVIDGPGLIGRHADAVRQGMEVVNKVIETADITGGASTFYSYMRGDKTGVVLGMAGMLLGPFGREGSAPARAAVNSLTKAGTHEVIAVAGKEIVPTRQVAEKLIALGKGVIDRVERGHIGGVGHPYPHINYTTAAGEKATIRIQSVGKQFYRKIRE